MPKQKLQTFRRYQKLCFLFFSSFFLILKQNTQGKKMVCKFFYTFFCHAVTPASPFALPKVSVKLSGYPVLASSTHNHMKALQESWSQVAGSRWARDSGGWSRVAGSREVGHTGWDALGWCRLRTCYMLLARSKLSTQCQDLLWTSRKIPHSV